MARSDGHLRVDCNRGLASSLVSSSKTEEEIYKKCKECGSIGISQKTLRELFSYSQDYIVVTNGQSPSETLLVHAGQNVASVFGQPMD